MEENRLESQVWTRWRWERWSGREPVIEGCRLPVVLWGLKQEDSGMKG